MIGQGLKHGEKPYRQNLMIGQGFKHGEKPHYGAMANYGRPN